MMVENAELALKRAAEKPAEYETAVKAYKKVGIVVSSRCVLAFQWEILSVDFLVGPSVG